MARPRIDPGFDLNAEIRRHMAQGGTAASITAALAARGVDVSPATITRRMRELRPAPATCPTCGQHVETKH